MPKEEQQETLVDILSAIDDLEESVFQIAGPENIRNDETADYSLSELYMFLSEGLRPREVFVGSDN